MVGTMARKGFTDDIVISCSYLEIQQVLDTSSKSWPQQKKQLLLASSLISLVTFTKSKTTPVVKYVVMESLKEGRVTV